MIINKRDIICDSCNKKIELEEGKISEYIKDWFIIGFMPILWYLETGKIDENNNQVLCPECFRRLIKLEKTITFQKLIEFLKIKKSGRTLPKEWKKLCSDYMNFKLNHIKNIAFESEIKEFESAIRIVKFLGMRTEEWEKEIEEVKKKIG